MTADKSEVCISGEKHGAGVENNSGQEGSRLKESTFGEKREGSGVTAEMKWGQWFAYYFEDRADRVPWLSAKERGQGGASEDSWVSDMALSANAAFQLT